MISLSAIPIDGSEGILKSISECPKGTIECKEVGCSNTCYCEDHCSWEKCFLEVPPSQCLLGTSGGWKLNTRKMYWTAEVTGALMYFYFQCCYMALRSKNVGKPDHTDDLKSL